MHSKGHASEVTTRDRRVTAIEAGRQVYKGTKMASEVEKNCKYTSFMSQSKSIKVEYATFRPIFFQKKHMRLAGVVENKP